MSPREIRPARPADAGVLAAIDAGVNINPWSERQFAAACGGDTQESTLVVDKDGRVDGFVVFSQVLDDASIHNIAVRVEYQGRGLGYLLLDSALRQMSRSGATRCLLEVRESNTTARHLYEGNGFELDGIRKNYYPTKDGREDALLMSRELSGLANERA